MTPLSFVLLLFFLHLFYPFAYANFNCFTIINGISYDLSSLSGVDIEGSSVSGAGSYSYDYYLNLCGTVSIGACAGHDAMLCQLDMYGNFVSALAYSNSSVAKPSWSLLDASNNRSGVVLTVQGQASQWCAGIPNRETIISFVCDPNAINPIKTFEVQENPTCVNNIKIITAAACPMPTPYPIPGFDNCSVAFNHASYDLSSLSGVDIEGSSVSGSRDSYHYYLNLCGTVSIGACAGQNAMLCQLDLNGQFVSTIAYSNEAVAKPFWSLLDASNDQSGVVLTVVGQGSYCYFPLTNRKTIISFVCDPNAVDPIKTFQVQEKPGCVYNIKIITAKACPTISHPHPIILSSTI